MRIQYTILSLILLALLIGNLAAWHISWLGIILGTLFLLWHGRGAGAWILPHESRAWQTFWGSLVLLSAVIIVGGAIYHVFAWTTVAIITVLVMITIAGEMSRLFLPSKNRNVPFPFLGDRTPDAAVQEITLAASGTGLAGFLVLALDAILFWYLFTHATTDAIRTPWQVVSIKFLGLYLVATFLLLAAISSKKHAPHRLLFMLPHTVLTVSVALIVYTLGYGYDPLIHRAAEGYVMRDGFILPKTFVYTGHYVLVVFLAKLFSVSHAVIDKLLVPLGAGLFIPPAILYLLTRGWKIASHHALPAALFFFLFPVAPFIATTPQDFANLMLVFTVVASLLAVRSPSPSWERAEGEGQRGIFPLWVPAILTAATLAIHPLTGIPALLLFGFVLLSLRGNLSIFPSPSRERAKGEGRSGNVLLVACYLLFATILIPLIFELFSHFFRGKSALITNIPAIIINLKTTFNPPIVFTKLVSDPFLFGAYFWRALVAPVFFAFAFFTSLTVIRRRSASTERTVRTRPRKFNWFIEKIVGRVSPERGQGLTDRFATTDAERVREVDHSGAHPPLAGAIDGVFSRGLAARIAGRVWEAMRQAASTPIALALALFLSVAILRVFFHLPGLAPHEQLEYPTRLLRAAFLILIPAALPALGGALAAIERWRPELKQIVFAGAAIVMTWSLYLSYPRVDAYEKSRAFNVSAADFTAVREIADDAKDTPYIVLANPIVAAAAIQEFGFFQYYQQARTYGDTNFPSPSELREEGEGKGEGEGGKVPPLFAYSIPPGGPLYQYYLDMVYREPLRSHVERAMDLAGVSRAYFVLNSYWADFHKIAPKAKTQADGWWEIKNGKTSAMVFRYIR